MKIHQFEFTGNAREYFGIWIVNLFLSIITLGIYTAWAKVRRLRYFYANTFLDGHNFDYHARPMSILIGRIIVLGALLIYNVLVNINPLASLLIVPYLFALPWIINKALRFRARVTSHRNIRFNFEGSYWRAFLVFAIMPILAAFSLGILVPVSSRMSANYIGNNLRYGTARFSTEAPLGDLYGNWFASILFFIAAGLIMAGCGALLGTMLGDSSFIATIFGQSGTPNLDHTTLNTIFIGVIAFYISFFLVYLFYGAGVRNIVYKATLLDDAHGFNSTISRLRYIWILVTNLFATILTIGLLRPWAAIRTWRYLVDNTRFLAGRELDGFVADKTPEGGAAGAEFLDIEGIDFGI